VKGEELGVHWNSIIMTRFELQKMNLTRDLVGFEKIATERFRGYIFIEDLLSRRVYGFTVTDMLNINNFWYGGRVVNIFEASTVEEYQKKLAADIQRRKYMLENGITEQDLARMDSINRAKTADKDKDTVNDPLKIAYDDDEEDNPKGKGTSRLTKKEVVDKKLFTGTFDNEIPVIMYIRYIKGNCPSGICSWEAIYKFGKQEEFIKLDVSRTDDGGWLFSEDPPIGGMELTFEHNVWTGNWASADIKTGYEVKMTEKPVSAKDVQTYDDIIQNGKWAKGQEDEKNKAEQPIKGINEGIMDGVF
jgi:hypothetical protein